MNFGIDSVIVVRDYFADACFERLDLVIDCPSLFNRRHRPLATSDQFSLLPPPRDLSDSVFGSIFRFPLLERLVQLRLSNAGFSERNPLFLSELPMLKVPVYISIPVVEVRTYGDDVLPRVRFIQQAQALGLTLKEVKDVKDVKELVTNEGRGGSSGAAASGIS
jgi:hypothetical protein